MTWLVERMDVRDLPPDHADLVKAWIIRHGVDINTVMPRLTVTSDDDGTLRLNLSQFIRAGGTKVVDHNLDVMATTPIVVDINPLDPPPWTVKE